MEHPTRSKDLMPLRPLVALVCAILLLAAILGGDTQSVHGQPPQINGDDHRAFDPSDLQEGKPLPGANYPWQPVAPSAPKGWAPTAPPAGVDLDVTYINRAPMYYAYCVQYPDGIPTLCPGTQSEQRWPAPGEVVTFTAHIVNKGTIASPSFDYRWSIDGVGVLSDTHPALAPGAETTISYAWPWGHTMNGERVVDDHTVGFEVDPDNLVAETYETNNQLVDRTNALGFRIAITPEMYEAYNTPLDPAFSYSAEDWLQRQIAAMNGAFAASSYAATPGGATERVRINEILVTPTPPFNDRKSDGGWFVNADYRLVSGGYDPATDVDWNLVHELSHQVGLIDLYTLGIYTTIVQVLDREGGPANFGFAWPHPGLMGGGDVTPHTGGRFYSSHSAGGISSSKGYRRGYYGEYQFDIPEQNYVLVLDKQGNPAEGVEVALYQRNGPPVWPGDATIDNIAEVSGTTGADGRLLLANRSVDGGVTTHTGHTLRDNPFGVVDVVGGRNIFLLKLSRSNHEEFAWLDITVFNLAYWQGDTLSHTFTFNSHLPPAGAPAEPLGLQARVEGDEATLCWQASPSPGVIGYRVYRAAPLTYAYEQAAGLVSGPCYFEAYAATRIYAITAVDSSGRESGFSNFAWVPRLIHPYAVSATSDGLLTILDPQNGYALLRQRPDGRYLQNLGSPHYHLESSIYLAADELDRLIISHPGDWYTDRHSVRVADRDANPLLEFGEQGSGPGQFETPEGVAVVGKLSSVEGPYADDVHTLLLLHFDGSYTGSQGESGTATGTTFQPGKYDQGVAVDASDTLTYPSAGNIQLDQGAVEFWLRPNWPGTDWADHTFFEIGDSWFNRMRVMKDGDNNLRFIVWDGSHEYDVGYPVGHWQAGEWHHVAATWQGTTIALYVDGQQRVGRDDANLPDTRGDTIYVGYSFSHGQRANAVLDEFRISDVPRIGQRGEVPYRILVTDRYNDRLQAFDELGNFVSAYGEHGAGPGQFYDPRGVAATDDGMVVVADANNSRLQILSFDGTEFTFVREVDAGLSLPTGVAIYGQDYILVADTGRVVLLDVEGNLVAEYTEPNDGYTGAFNLPRGVWADCSGEIVVAERGNQRVVRILDSLPVLADFTASPISGGVPLTVTFTNTSCGNYTESLWDLGDGLTSTLTNPVHTYTQPGVYTVRLTANGPGGSGTETKLALISVWSEQRLYLPLILKGYVPTYPECVEQIENGGFEDDSAWSIGSSVRPARYTSERAHSGQRSVLLGYKPGEEDNYAYSSVRQSITIPANTDSATLTFWYYPLSDLDEGDRQECLLLDEQSHLLAVVHRTNVDTAAWINVSYDLGAYAGQTIQVYCNAYNDGDGAGVTGFYLDDVSVTVCTEVAPPPP
jgi:PKD repeat protein